MPNISSSDRSTPRFIKTELAVFLGFLALGLIIYFPVLNKGLLSDDFLVMRRVGLEGVVFIKGFFRPLSDITLYFNYWMGGFEGIYYTSFNLLLHVFGSFFLYLFCKRWNGLPATNRKYFAILVGLLFLTYPFHNESVVWGVGRASLLAGFFGIAAMLVSVSNLKFSWQLVWANLFYFIGLTAYESIFLLPAMIMNESLDAVFNSKASQKTQKHYVHNCNQCWLNFHRKYDVILYRSFEKFFGRKITSKLFGYYQWEASASKTYNEYFEGKG